MIKKIGNTFYLSGKQVSYIMLIGEKGDLLHYYYGRKIPTADYSPYNPAWPLWTRVEEENYTLEFIEQEYPGFGHVDLRPGSYKVRYEDTSEVTRLTYKSYDIRKGTQEIKGMPTVFGAQAETLEISLGDELTGLEVKLYYTIFDEYDVVIRKTEFVNNCGQSITLENVASAAIDLPVGNYEVIHFAGSWAREFEMCRNNLTIGTNIDIASARGASSHQVNPFVMVCEKDSDEDKGEVYGFSLIYSGDHSTRVSMDQYGGTRVAMGINPDTFLRVLEPGECFVTPECVLCYSDKGFNQLSLEYHNLYRKQLCKSKRANEPRPILINNWEGTYFDFNEEKLLGIVEKAKEAGIELFVLDDGWFGKRNDDRCSLGDWYVNTEKLPNGMKGLADKINGMGMDFGLWFEPEMVNPDSDLYRAHPDWAIQIKGRKLSLSRNQLILDLSKPEVCEYIINQLSNILGTANISYVKWDMNRSMTDRPYAGYNYDYIMGLYSILETITERFPEVLFEGCASGGGRFDPGILAYMPQIWASDNTDAVSRMQIQYGASFVYPLSSISAHVTEVPNHQNGRITPLKTRGAVAYTGTFGYEMDLRNLNDEEFLAVKEQVVKYKEIRTLLQSGNFYRLRDPFHSNYCGWQIVDEKQQEVFVMSSKILAQNNRREEMFKLKGLKPDYIYRDKATNEKYSGAELMYRGLDIIYEIKDFTGKVFHLVAE